EGAPRRAQGQADLDDAAEPRPHPAEPQRRAHFSAPDAAARDPHDHPRRHDSAASCAAPGPPETTGPAANIARNTAETPASAAEIPVSGVQEPSFCGIF